MVDPVCPKCGAERQRCTCAGGSSDAAQSESLSPPAANPVQQTLALGTPGLPPAWRGEVRSRLMDYQQRRAGRLSGSARQPRPDGQAAPEAPEPRRRTGATLARFKPPPQETDPKIIPFRRSAAGRASRGGDPASAAPGLNTTGGQLPVANAPAAPSIESSAGAAESNRVSVTGMSAEAPRVETSQTTADPSVGAGCDSRPEAAASPQPTAPAGAEAAQPAVNYVSSVAAAPFELPSTGGPQSKVALRGSRPWSDDSPLPLSPRLWPTDAEVEKIEVPLSAASPPERLRLAVPAATVSRRLAAASLDGLAIACGAALFAGVCYYVLGKPALNHSFVVHRLAPGLAAVPGLLSAGYILLSLYLCGTTLGMRRARLAVVGFDGLPARGRALRQRAWTSLLSLGALGLGYWWMLFDDDHLTWHDHLSRTYLAVTELTGHGMGAGL